MNEKNVIKERREMDENNEVHKIETSEVKRKGINNKPGVNSNRLL